MTEKRFRVIKVDDMYGVSDDIAEYTVAWDKSKLIMDNLCDLLNELHEENQLLHKMNAEAIDFMYDNFDLSIIFTDRELNNICNEMGWELSEKGIKIAQLEKENERLKQQLSYIEYRFTEYRIKVGDRE